MPQGPTSVSGQQVLAIIARMVKARRRSPALSYLCCATPDFTAAAQRQILPLLRNALRDGAPLCNLAGHESRNGLRSHGRRNDSIFREPAPDMRHFPGIDDRAIELLHYLSGQACGT